MAQMNKKSTGKKSAPAAAGRGGLRLMFKIVLPVMVIAVASAAFLALARSKPEIKPRAVNERAWTVEAVPVLIADHQPTIKLYGEAVAGRKVDLRALVAGEIIEAAKNFREGGIVSKGEVLLKLDPFDYRASLVEAKANLDEAEAKLREIKARIALERAQIEASRTELALAGRDLERARDLIKQNLVSQKTVDDKEYIKSQRHRDLRQRRSNLAIETARAAQQKAVLSRLESRLSRARRDLKNTKVTAPFNAYISALNAEVGRMVSSSDRVATLIDADRIDVRFNFSDAQFGRIIASEKNLIGRPIVVIWRIGETTLRYHARIERVSAQITASSGGVQVYARLDDPRLTVPLRPGAFVEIAVDDKIFERVARLPVTSLYDGDKVFVVNNKRRLEPRKVQLLGYAENDILVRGALKTGDKVVTTRISQAKDGLLVTVK